MRLRNLLPLSAALLLAACAEQAPSTPPTTKPVKVEVAGARAGPTVDSFVGTIRARQRTELSFETYGRLHSIKVDVGDHVRAGQVLAQLDEAPTRWRLDKAVAERKAASVTLTERETWLRQQEALMRDNIIAPAALQLAQASYQQAVSQLTAAEAAVASARRDLELTRITAPFDGRIVARLAQPFVDIAAGQSVLQLEAGQEYELISMLPDVVAEKLAIGKEAFAYSGEQRLALKLARLSSRSENGSLVQAIFQIKDAPANIRSGTVVELELARAEDAQLTLPNTALINANDGKTTNVFIIKSGSLHRRAITTDGHLLPNGRIAITSGVANGEHVVIAGTAFLKDGQAVVEHQSQTILQGVSQ
ncbi:efflux RND transporter periplasmic adaptor subunit [Pseudoduganella sp. FT93W]|uniref:Efflux RND transporter periplasmic adaptor subunit n=1 Tax=Duganella fentianensis TaxID=2692177 RepID=A0A845HYF0_9BURK|nr:efflux RND transporter periplasmic adaptor subunit [Duganella fentianensis]MYN44777.1 efflux RND transporter periplasmic adaptor subunit [Duganella fentianensis]